MTKDIILEHWNQRAQLGELAGSNDRIAKELEIRAISKHINSGMTVAEFGCGNGITALELIKNNDILLHGYDFSPGMIEAAQKMAENIDHGGRISFSVGDVRNEPELPVKYDTVYCERMIINLPDWEAQSRAIKYLIKQLKVGGRFIMCENSSIGLGHLNNLRVSAGLDSITPPWHNVYLQDDLVASLELSDAKLIAVEPFSATYYFLSRVVNGWVAKKEGRQPSYDALVNQLALEMPSFGDCAQGKLWIFERNPT